MILWLNGWKKQFSTLCTCGERVNITHSAPANIIGLVVNHGCPIHAPDLKRYSRHPDACRCTVTVDKQYGWESPIYAGSENCPEHNRMSNYGIDPRCTCHWGYEHHGPGLDEPIIEERDPFCFSHSHYPFDRAYMK